jgi:ketosteroid isomerase-like protein
MTDRQEAATEGFEAALDLWQEGIAAGDLEKIAGAFTPDALFKGLHPEHAIGREGVKRYYGSQEPGLTVEYRTLHLAELDPHAVVAFLEADFHTGRSEIVRTHITTVLRAFATG